MKLLPLTFAFSLCGRFSRLHRRYSRQNRSQDASPGVLDIFKMGKITTEKLLRRWTTSAHHPVAVMAPPTVASPLRADTVPVINHAPTPPHEAPSSSAWPDT